MLPIYIELLFLWHWTDFPSSKLAHSCNWKSSCPVFPEACPLIAGSLVLCQSLWLFPYLPYLLFWVKCILLLLQVDFNFSKDPWSHISSTYIQFETADFLWFWLAIPNVFFLTRREQYNLHRCQGRVSSYTVFQKQWFRAEMWLIIFFRKLVLPRSVTSWS